MNKVNRIKYIKIGIVFVLATLLLLGGKALAQLVTPATEHGGEVIEMTPSYISGDPAYRNITPPDENPTTGVNSPSASFSYYQVAGATLRGRSSTTQYQYDSHGCAHITSSVDIYDVLNTELTLPDDSVIKYLRVYYTDTNPSTSVYGFITLYQPGQDFIDLVNVGSTDVFTGGFGYAVSERITETVDNEKYAYTLIGWPIENNDSNQICGLRVAYYPPFHGTIFMPVVRR